MEMDTDLVYHITDGYFFYNVIPLSAFEELSFMEIIEILHRRKLIDLPCTVKIKYFPTYDDYIDDSTYSFHDIGVGLEITYDEESHCLLTFTLDENCNIINNDTEFNNALLKTLDLLNWYCKELSLGNLSTFDNDIRKNIDYFMLLASKYNVEHLIEMFFITGTPKYPDIDNEQLEKLKWFIANYEQLKKKHPLTIKGDKDDLYT